MYIYIHTIYICIYVHLCVLSYCELLVARYWADYRVTTAEGSMFTWQVSIAGEARPELWQGNQDSASLR